MALKNAILLTALGNFGKRFKVRITSKISNGLRGEARVFEI